MSFIVCIIYEGFKTAGTVVKKLNDARLSPSGKETFAKFKKLMFNSKQFSSRLDSMVSFAMDTDESALTPDKIKHVLQSACATLKQLYEVSSMARALAPPAAPKKPDMHI